MIMAKTDFKQTEIGELPEGWELTPLRELAVVNDKTIDKSFTFNELEYIDIASVDKGRILERKKIQRNEAPSRAQRICRDNDILLSTVRPNLKHFAFLNESKPNTIASTGFAVISAQKIVPRFLYHYLTTDKYTDFLSAIADAHTSTYPAFNPDVLENSLIPVPPEPEQRAIAKILSDLDDKIELNHRMNKTLESIAQAVFKRWFVDFEFPGYEKTKFIDGLPEGWAEVKLGDFAEILNGFAFKSKDFMSSGVFLLRTKNFTENGYIMRDDTACLPENFYDEYKGFRLKTFDVLLVMVGASVGKMAIVQSSVLPALQNQNMWNFRSKSGSGQLFLNFLVKKIVQENMGTASGSARDFFRKDYFRSIDFILPTEGVLKEFDKQVSPIFDQIDKNLTEIQILSQIRDSLLPRLMSGTIRAGRKTSCAIERAG